MTLRHSLFALGFAGLGCLTSLSAFAQDAAQADTQRDINQQQRIENGLQSGQLTTREAGQLEREQQHIDHVESSDLKRGPITSAEQARLSSMQNRASQQIYADKHNGVTGNPESVSSERMQADVQRNVNQQQRIENGLRNNALNDRQAGRLEAGQARVDRTEANAARNGNISGAEQGRIQRRENRQSRRIYRAKH